MIPRPREKPSVTRGLRAPTRCALGLMAALCLAACRPSVVWYGRSPDRRHRVEVIEQGSSQSVRLDGQAGKPYRGVGIEALAWSPDSRRLAFAAERDDGWTVVLDGRELGVWDGMGEIVWSPDSRQIAYSAQRGDTWRVVRDGREHPVFDALRPGTLRYSPRGRRLAYIGERGGAQMAVIDGVVGPPCDGIAQLTFSADDAAVAYVARFGERASLVYEGPGAAAARSTLTRYDAILEVALAPRGGRAAFVAVRGGQAIAVVDGIEQPPGDAVTSLTWSPDGRRVAWIARRGQAERAVVDGDARKDLGPVREGSLAFSPDGAHDVVVVRQPGGWAVVFDGEPGQLYDDVTNPVFAPVGGRWAYVARRGSTSVVVVDGRESVPYAWAGDLIFGPGGEGPAYLARRGAHTLVAHGHRRTALDGPVVGTLVYSADGRRWACLVAVAAVRRLYVAVDGVPRRAIDFDEIVAAAMKQAPDLGALPGGGSGEGALDVALLRRWVAAELQILTP